MKFLKYEKAGPEEKYLGLATISLYDKIVLKYKIVMKKDGSSWFCSAPSLKQPGTDEYISAFIIDSNSEKEEIEGFIRHNVKICMQQDQQQAQTQQQAQAQIHHYGSQQQAQQQQYGQARPAPVPAQQSIFDDSQVPF